MADTTTETVERLATWLEVEDMHEEGQRHTADAILARADEMERE